MADSDPGERNYDNMLKMLSDLNKDLEKLLEEMEKISGRLISQTGCLPLSFQELRPSLDFWTQILCLLTRPSLPDHQVTVVPQNLTLTTEYCPELFSDFICVCIFFLPPDSYLLRAEIVTLPFITGHQLVVVPTGYQTHAQVLSEWEMMLA